MKAKALSQHGGGGGTKGRKDSTGGRKKAISSSRRRTSLSPFGGKRRRRRSSRSSLIAEKKRALGREREKKEKRTRAASWANRRGGKESFLIDNVKKAKLKPCACRNPSLQRTSRSSRNTKRKGGESLLSTVRGRKFGVGGKGEGRGHSRFPFLS